MSLLLTGISSFASGVVATLYVNEAIEADKENMDKAEGFVDTVKAAGRAVGKQFKKDVRSTQDMVKSFFTSGRDSVSDEEYAQVLAYIKEHKPELHEQYALVHVSK